MKLLNYTCFYGILKKVAWALQDVRERNTKPGNDNLEDKRLMKYIISQRNNLYTEDNKVYYNGKMIEYEGDFEEAVLNKKVEIL